MSIRSNAKKCFALMAVSLLSLVNSTGIEETSVKQARRFYAMTSAPIQLSIYNSADYIAEDEKDDAGHITSKGIVSKFEDYARDELGMNVSVVYSTFDTNETMLSELKTGRASYDLVVPSDYVIQKMIREDMITPFDKDSTPQYDQYVSPWIKEQMDSIDIDGTKGLVNQYARGYMWGTLGLLYNPTFAGVISRGISEEEMDEDMMDWASLWDEKYYNLLAIKDSMRDTYALGVLYTYEDEFKDLKNQYDAGALSKEEYNEKATEIFNRNSDKQLEEVRVNLDKLKKNAFGFEVDSGKNDMAKGDMFAINLAWSGDAAFAMDMADENNEALLKMNPEADQTILKYSLPSTGANIWFDGWVMPKGILNRPGHKKAAEAFVDFISDPARVYGDENDNPDQMTNVAQNMDYIGYTSVIAGDSVLDLIRSYYDLRYDEETGEMDESALDDLTLVNASDIESLSAEEKEHSYYKKDVSYFFKGTLKEHAEEENPMVFAVAASEKNRQFDTQYPDQEILPSLCIMADFGDQTDALVAMWEKVKNTNLPIWAYVLILVLVVLGILFAVLYGVHKRRIKAERRARKKERQEKEKKLMESQKAQEKTEKEEKKKQIREMKAKKTESIEKKK